MTLQSLPFSGYAALFLPSLHGLGYISLASNNSLFSRINFKFDINQDQLSSRATVSLIEEKRIEVRKRHTETHSAFLWFLLNISTYFYILSYIIYAFDTKPIKLEWRYF